MKMKEMFKDYKTMVVEPAKEFNEQYRKEIIIFSLVVHVVIVGGTMVWINRKNIKESIKSKFNRGKKKTES